MIEQGIRPGTLTRLLSELARAPEGDAASPLVPGSVIGRFELVREIGRGAFGVVWEARDRELGRSVAFKVVRAGGRPALRAERLALEAEAAARLTHPNIVTLHDAGRCERGPYLVLELLRGETLEARLERERLAAAECVHVAVEIARALAHAHAAGVAHRDLKPGNVFLCEDGRVKVLDFGMAHAFGRRKIEGGTPAFMAPEQRSGAPEDERSDVFALGVILHRMLTGALPPGGARGRSGGRPAPDLARATPPAVAALVSRMLERDPRKRPRDGAEVLAALSAIVAGPQPEAPSTADGDPAGEAPPAAEGRARPRRRAGSLREEASIAVLPFADLSPARDQDYFCEGIAEELLGALSMVDDLRVAARGSSFQLKGQALDSREVGKALGVATLLEGSVRKAGNRVRISARLVNASDRRQIWAETFDRTLDDIFAIQEEIAQAVVRAFELRLSVTRQGRITRVGTRDAQAYELYLRGRKFLMLHGEPALRVARQMFRGALELDPSFAQAHAGLADADFIMLQWNIDHERAVERRAEALAESEEALRLQPDLAEAHLSRANVLSLLDRGEEAEEEYRCALELNPSLGDTSYFYARHLLAAGRRHEAALAFEEAARRSPDDYASLGLLMGVYEGLGDRAKALATARRCVETAERRLRHEPNDVRAMYLVAGAYALLGERERAVERLSGALELQPDEFTTLYNVACSFARLGERERALEALDRAVGSGRGSRKWFENDSDLDTLRGDPRFEAIKRRLQA
jgi:TolB-like protein/Tfp pilus assembly protein PilF